MGTFTAPRKRRVREDDRRQHLHIEDVSASARSGRVRRRRGEPRGPGRAERDVDCVHPWIGAHRAGGSAAVRPAAKVHGK